VPTLVELLVELKQLGTSGLHASWAFGIFPGDHAARRAPVKPSRPSALAMHQLPPLATADDVARLVGIGEDQLTRLMRPGVGPGSGYVEFEIPKAKGGTRRIAAPRAPLRKVQRAILDQILARVPMHDACHGFVAGRSTVTNATPHQRAALVVKRQARRARDVAADPARPDRRGRRPARRRGRRSQRAGARR